MGTGRALRAGRLALPITVMMTWIRRIFWLGTICYWVLLLTLTHMPASKVHVPGMLTDKQCHFLAYFGLSFGLGLTLLMTLPGKRWVPFYVIAVAMAYGAIDERTQLLVGRDCELGDWYADVAGACSAGVLLFIVGLFIKSRRPISTGRHLIAGFDGIVPPSAAAEAR